MIDESRIVRILFGSPRGQAIGIGLSHKIQPSVAAIDQVQAVSVRMQIATRADRRNKTGPRHIGRSGLSAQIGGIQREKSLEYPFVLKGTHLWDAVVDMHVGHIDVGVADQCKTVKSAVSGIHDARPAQSHDRVRLERPFDQVAIRQR